MTMLTDFFENAHIMDKTTVSDGMGGATTQWHDGAMIRVGFSANRSTEARIAEQNGIKALWTIVHTDMLEFRQNDVIRRDKTGQLFRITGNSIDMHTPPMADVQFMQVSAEVITL